MFLDHPTTEELLDHVEAESQGCGDPAIAEHLTWCEECRELAGFARSSHRSSVDSEPVTAGDLGRRFALAAAILLIALLSWFGLHSLRLSSENESALAADAGSDGLIFRDDFEPVAPGLGMRTSGEGRNSVIARMDFEQPESLVF